MSLTRVQIISNALMQLGHKPITSLSGGDSLVVAADQIYDIKITSVLTRSNWRFATQIQQLSQLAEAPPKPWKTAYQLPAGYLKMLILYPYMYAWDIYAGQNYIRFIRACFQWSTYFFLMSPCSLRILLITSHMKYQLRWLYLMPRKQNTIRC